MAKLRAGPLWLDTDDASDASEPTSGHDVEPHSGLLMSEHLDILRHVWFAGPDHFAPADAIVWRHAEMLELVRRRMVNNLPAKAVDITILAALAAGRVRTDYCMIPSDRKLSQLSYDAQDLPRNAAGLSKSQVKVPRALRDGWQRAPAMPAAENGEITPN